MEARGVRLYFGYMEKIRSSYERMLRMYGGDNDVDGPFTAD